MTDQTLTSVLLPCWNAPELTRVCLQRLRAGTTRPYELILVDNGSRDRRWLAEEARALRGAPLLKGVRLLRNARNRGYPIAMNQALRAARGGLLLFANADAAPAAGWLEEMMPLFARRPRLAGLAPSSNAPEPLPLRRPWALPPWYSGPEEMSRFAAACALRETRAFIPAEGFLPGFWFMSTRRALERVGGFDEGFSPGGYEDWDLQLRLRRAGYELGVAPRAYVHHVWRGVARRNGQRGDAAFRLTRARFQARYPELSGPRLEGLWRGARIPPA